MQHKIHIYFFKEFWSVSVNLNVSLSNLTEISNDLCSVLRLWYIKKDTDRFNFIYLETNFQFSGNSFKKEFHHMEFLSVSISLWMLLCLSFICCCHASKEKGDGEKCFKINLKDILLLRLSKAFEELINYKYTTYRLTNNTALRMQDITNPSLFSGWSSVYLGGV